MSAWRVLSTLAPLVERAAGGGPWSELRRLRAAQWYSPGLLEERAVAALQPLLRHAYQHVPHYRARFDEAGLEPGRVRTLADLARLPVTTRAELRAGFPARTVAANLPARRRFRTTTSGSTGLPFEFYADRAATSLRLASYLFFWDWAGVGPGQARLHLILSLRPAAATPGSSRWSRTARQILLGERLEPLSAIERRPDTLLDRLRGLSPGERYLIWGLPSSIARLAAALLQRESHLPSRPSAVIATGETLNPLDAALIERAFGCRITNHYSAYEVLHLAQSCPDQPDQLHVNSERAIVRVRPDGSPCAVGEAGRVIVTDLANWVMPFLNYEIGDWAVAGGPCRCGRGLPTLTSLEGRLGEAIRTPDGRLVSPVTLGWFLTYLRQALPYVWEYQAIQTAPDAVTLRVVPTASFSGAFAAELQTELERFLGPGLRVTIEAVERIELEPSGKRLAVKSVAGAA